MNELYRTKDQLEKIEQETLANYASLNSQTKGRVHPEEEHNYRTAFQRDRDRIIHSAAFRRLKDKTQVFSNPDDDHFRTRLTHTMEVAQISRTIAKTLRLNEELAEAIALVHDLGHTPFGHAGEFELRDILKNKGGFNHNAQSLRVVDHLENRYPDFVGLNLSYEVREGIVKHETDYDFPVDPAFGDGKRASLEAQLVNIADEIAYNAHDVDDACFAGIINWKKLRDVPLIDKLYKQSLSSHPNLSERKRHYLLIRLLINYTVSDLVSNSISIISGKNIKTIDDVKNCEINLIQFSKIVKDENKKLKKYLYDNVYRHPDLKDSNKKAQQCVRMLFDAYMNGEIELKPKYQARFKEEEKELVIKDYIAGMTDRFALQTYRNLTGQSI